MAKSQEKPAYLHALKGRQFAVGSTSIRTPSHACMDD